MVGHVYITTLHSHANSNFIEKISFVRSNETFISHPGCPEKWIHRINIQSGAASILAYGKEALGSRL